MPDWTIGEDARMAEYRGEDQYSMPMSDRIAERWICDQCGEELDSDGECIGCLDAYWDAMESRMAHFDQYQHRRRE